MQKLGKGPDLWALKKEMFKNCDRKDTDTNTELISASIL